MAYGLKGGDKTELHQALHGYSDGHQQLALSVSLMSRDQKTLLVMSDISGPGARLDENGYLTGFPLPDSGMFALARTWPAPEMSRPGCVWTHTLLIDFADLAILKSLTDLAAMFRRPSGLSDAQSYQQSQQLETSSYFSRGPSNLSEDWVKQVLAALYGYPSSRIVTRHPGQEADHAVLAVWSQQWPRLRRNFRFCTFAVADRSLDSTTFDLQVLPTPDKRLRSRFLKAVDAEAVNLGPTPWVKYALQDLLQPDTNGLRSFLRKVGSDTMGGREIFQPMCRLHLALDACTYQPTAIHDAISILHNELGLNQSRIAQSTVVETALDHIEGLDEQSFEFLWNRLELLRSDVLKENAVRLGRFAWHSDPKRFLEGPTDDIQFNTIVNHTLAELDYDELIEGVKSAPSLTGKVIERRPELTSRPNFWSQIEAIDGVLKTILDNEVESSAVVAIITAGRNDLASRIAQVFGGKSILTALNLTQEKTAGHTSPWIRAVAHNTGMIADFLVNEHGIHKTLLYALSQELTPDAVPNDYGADPWVIALQNATGDIDGTASVYLSAYLLSRALSLSSRSPAELTQMSFEKIHRAAANDLLPESVWRLVESQLPRSMFWFEWDRCERLRACIIDLFVSQDLSPRIFGHLVENDHLFAILVNGAARNRRGRYYLERVKQTMKNEIDPTFRRRAKMVEEVLL